MKINRIVLIVLLLGAFGGRAGDFVNLDFNSPDLSRVKPNPFDLTGRSYVLPMEDAFRGWTLVWSDWPGRPLELPYGGYVPLTGGGSPIGLTVLLQPYSVGISGYWPVSIGEEPAVRPTLHLSQIGRVPEDTFELRYWISEDILPPPTGRPMSVYVNGQLQERRRVPGGEGLLLSRFAGQEVKLEFVFPGGSHSQGFLFDIYGLVPIPEPSTWALLTLGGAGLWLGLRRGASSSSGLGG